MNEDLVDYFVHHCNHSDHYVDPDADPAPWDGFYPEDDSYDDFLFSGANLYGGY